MPDILQYDFMRQALLIGTVIALITPLIGVTVVLKRLSMIGDALSHTSLAGVAIGLVAGINPIGSAIIFSIIAAFAIERIRKVFSHYSELAIAIIMSTGIGLAGIFSSFLKNNSDFNSYLFGSIVSTSKSDVMLITILGAVVLLVSVLLYRELFYIAFDEGNARLAGIPVNIVNFTFTLLTAVTVSVSARAVGTLVVSSLLVLPVASSMQVAKSYKQTVIYSVCYALFSTLAGLIISYYADLRPGGTIVLIGVFLLLLSIGYSKLRKI